MIVDQLLAAASVQDVFRDPLQRHRELLDDVMAVGGGRPGTEGIDGSGFLMRPAILRRLAHLLADALPEGVDRIAGAAEHAAPLVTAVALHTGLPFVLVRDDTGELLGDLHAGERVVLLLPVSPADTKRSVAVLEQRGARLVSVLSALHCNGDERHITLHSHEAGPREYR